MAHRLAVATVDQPSNSTPGSSTTLDRCSEHDVPSSATIAPRILQRGEVALELLLEARRFAQDLDRSTWDFALEIERLREAGLAHNDLRWLVCKGYLQQATEVLNGSGPERSFQHGGPLTFTHTSCFVLTESGSDFIRKFAPRAGARQAPVPPQHPLATVNGSNGHAILPTPPWAESQLRPSWDRDRQELRLGDYLVKQFKVPAPNQEMVIAVFQEEGWPARIDDPLPPRSDLDPKRRLHDTINSLNRNQKNPLIRFIGDGSGQGVRWEVAEAASPVLHVDLAAKG